MTADISRGALTSIILENLAIGTGKPVGDGTMPNGVGWVSQPNAPGTVFVPYTVVTPMSASSSSGPFDADQGDWQLPYSVWAYGVRRDQCEAMSDLARHVLYVMRGETYALGENNYTVQQVRTDVIGACSRYDSSTDPAYWGQQDSYTVWVTEELS